MVLRGFLSQTDCPIFYNHAWNFTSWIFSIAFSNVCTLLDDNQRELLF